MKLIQINEAISALDAVKKLEALEAQYGEDIELSAVMAHEYEPSNYFMITEPHPFELEDETLPIAQLYPGQETVDASGVLHYLNGTGRSGNEQIKVCRDQTGKLFVQDGHHRLTAAILRGENQVKAKVATVSEFGENEQGDQYVVYK